MLGYRIYDCDEVAYMFIDKSRFKLKLSWKFEMTRFSAKTCKYLANFEIFGFYVYSKYVFHVTRKGVP